MADSSKVFNAQQSANCPLGDDTAPQGFDPNATAFNPPPVGKHGFKIVDFSVEVDHEFKWKGVPCILNQLRPVLAVRSGPHAGCRVTAFLPMPTPGRVMLPELASQWGNFIKSAGWDLAPGKMIPAGFKVGDILNRDVDASISQSTDSDGKPKLQNNGKPQMNVDLYGFSRPDPKGASTPATSTTPAAAAPAKQKIDL